MKEESGWRPVEVKTEPHFGDEEFLGDLKFKSKGLSPTYIESRSDDCLENSISCSTIGVPSTSGSTSSTGHETPSLALPLKQEIIEEEEYFSEDSCLEVDFEASCTTYLAPSISDARLEPSVFCSVSGLPLASESVSSSGAPSLSQQIKVENIKNEDACPVLPTKQDIEESAGQESDLTCQERDRQMSVPFDNYHQIQIPQQISERKDRQEINEVTVAKLMPTSSSLSDSSQPTHFEETKFSPCQQCEAQFSLKSVLETHLPSHLGAKSFTCEQCQARFVRKSCLRRHIFTHSGKKPFSCDQCPRQFNNKHNLETHRRVHLIATPFSCDQCHAQFTQKSSLRVHLRIHSSEKRFSCERCQAQFARKEHFIDHSRRIRSGQQPFCVDCRARFRRKCDLNAHLLIHLKKKPYSCEQCQVHFFRKFDLEQHLRIHSWKKSFSCERCQAQFSKKERLDDHFRRIHLEEKPFSCEQCQARFSRKRNRDVHLLIHSNKTRFSCEQCQAQFTRKRHLNDHLRIHWREEPLLCEQLQTVSTTLGQQETFISQNGINVKSYTDSIKKELEVDSVEVQDKIKSEDVYLARGFPSISSADPHQEPSVFCSVIGLPLACESAVSSGAPASTQQIKVENIEDEHIFTDTFDNDELEPPSSSLGPDSLEFPAYVKSEELDNNLLQAELNEEKNTGQEADLTYEEKVCQMSVPAVSYDQIQMQELKSDQHRKVNKSNESSLTSSLLSEPSVPTQSQEKKLFTCKQCQAQFSKKYSLSSHLLVHTSEERKPFSCKHCQAQFGQRSTFNKHKLIHSSKKHFSCEQCQAQFMQRRYLMAHLKTHSGKKPFSCEQCQAQFGRRSVLQNHLRIHSNEKPFSCDQCQAQFRHRSALYTHKLVHSK